MSRARVWTCQRQAKGVKCGHRNPSRKRTCVACGKPKPARRRPAHMSALDLSYEAYVELNGGEVCAICGAPPRGRRLDRDHCHASGRPRGLLCHRCNRTLATHVTINWMLKAIAYLERPAGL